MLHFIHMHLSNLLIIPEMFLGISIVYLLLHGTLLSVRKQRLLFHDSMFHLGILILFFVLYLLVNDPITSTKITTCFNNTIVNDYLSYSSKVIITSFSLFSFFIIQQYVNDQKINHFEYVIVLLFAVLGLMLMCAANDLITAYLAMEMQSLAFYTLSAFKRNSTFSVDAGLKYFVLGSFSSGLFLFGSSFVYGTTGTVNFEDLKDLFFCLTPDNSLDLAHLSFKENYSAVMNGLNL